MVTESRSPEVGQRVPKVGQRVVRSPKTESRSPKTESRSTTGVEGGVSERAVRLEKY